MTTISDAELRQLAVLNGAQHVGTPYVLLALGEPDGTLNVSPPSNDGDEGAPLLLEEGVRATHVFVFLQLRRDSSKFQGVVSFVGAPVVGESPGVTVNGNLYDYTFAPGDTFDDLAAALETAIEAGEDIAVDVEAGPVLRLTAEDSAGGVPSWDNTFTLEANSSPGTTVFRSPDSANVEWELWGRLPRPDGQIKSLETPDSAPVDAPSPLAWQRIRGNGELDGSSGHVEENTVFRIRVAGLDKAFVRPKSADGIIYVGIVPCTLAEP